MKTLVVYYSRSGHTRTAAEALARALRADCEEIVDFVDRSGVRGYLRSGADALFSRRVDVAPLAHDPAAYDLVVFGTPVWMERISSPVRSLLLRLPKLQGKIAFFVTEGSRGGEVVFARMERIAGEPIATMELTEADVEGRGLVHAIDDFVRTIRAHFPEEKATPPKQRRDRAVSSFPNLAENVAHP